MALIREGGYRLRRAPTETRGAKTVVSVVTVTFNAVDALRRTLESVHAQRWDGIEHIVIDGASSDGSVDLLETWDDRVALWRSERDDGIYDAMNKALARATGQHVLFLNSGDVLQGEVLFAGRELDRLLPVRADDYWGRARMLRLRDLRLGMPYCHQGILFRNRGLAPFDASLRIAADYEFLLANLEQAGLKPPTGHESGCVVFDTSGVSNRRVLARDQEAARIVLRRFGRLHWLRFWALQGMKLGIRRLFAR